MKRSAPPIGSLAILSIVTSAAAAPAADAPGAVPSPVQFTIHRVEKYRSEACGVGDFNNDGKPDIVTGSAHKHGIFWYEQVKKGDEVSWRRHVIDDSWKQAHSIALADIDGDGDLDLVTGKRFMAHNGGDSGEYEPLGVYWYELKRGPKPEWIKHAITYGEGIGSGLAVQIADMDNDGDLDFVVTGKWGGPAWLENKSETDSTDWVDVMPPADWKGSGYEFGHKMLRDTESYTIRLIEAMRRAAEEMP